MGVRRSRSVSETGQRLRTWQAELVSRRAFLLRMAGGSMAALFPLRVLASRDAGTDESQRWQLLAAVQDHLLPSEPGIPGAREVNALGYLRFVISDSLIDAQDRAFVLEGALWLEDRAVGLSGRSFLALDEEQKERVLREIAGSDAGENWLSTLLTYLFEALLTDPVYGGNPGGVGWKWLEHVPGFPRPPLEKRYWLL